MSIKFRLDFFIRMSVIKKSFRGKLDYNITRPNEMQYHITLARNNVIGKLGGSRSPCSLDDFSEPCTSAIVKKRTGTPSFCTLLIS